MKPLHLLSITCITLLLFFIPGCNSSGKSEADSKQKVFQEEKAASPIFSSDPAAEESLRQSALDGLKERVDELLRAGTSVDAVDEEGHTALMFASFNGHSSIILALLEKGARIDQRDTMGRTALLYASTGPFPEAVKILLDKGALPNIVDSNEHFTPLMHAAAEGNLDVVKLLLEHGADWKLKDIDGDNAEFFAREAGHLELADYLSTLH